MKTAKQPGTFALVTGGSQGIGKAIAGALAAEGYNLLLVALPDDALEAAAETLRATHRCDVKTFGIDLRHDGADCEVGAWALGLHVPVSILVNNAGFGHLGAFGQFTRDFYHDLLQVNVLNGVGLTRLLLEELHSHGGFILNVGSVASFFPIPYKTVYASSKFFMFAFSRGLREELHNSGVSVSLLCPGPVYTNAEVNARIDCAGRVGRWMSLQPEKVARKAVRRMLKGKWLITPGVSSRMALILRRIMPSALLQRQLARNFSRDQRAI
jgi:short-subunit dehydrogenase